MPQRRGTKRRQIEAQSSLTAIDPPVESTKFPLRAVDSDQIFDIFIKRGAYWTVFDRISSFLPIGDIHVLRRTCRAVQPIYDELARSQWNVDTRLKYFFKDPVSFRKVLGQCDGLISGDFALQYFERVLWKDSSCDIFVKSEKSEQLKKHVIAECYRLESTSQVELENRDGTIKAPKFEVLTYTQCSDIPKDCRKIKIIETIYTPLMTILESVHATALVNVISWNKAYALFAQPTFMQYKAYMLKPANDEYGPLLGDLSTKGWRTQPIVWRTDEDDIYDAWLGRTDCRGKSEICRRRIGDPLTWQISFSTTDMDKSKTPDSVLEYSDFEIAIAVPSLRNDAPEYAVPRYLLKTHSFRSLVLRYEYTSCREIIQTFWSRLQTLTQMELLKIKPSQRPAALMVRGTFNSYEKMCMASFDPPESWTFHDDELPRWIDQVEHVSCRRVKKMGNSQFKRDMSKVAPYYRASIH